MREAKQLRILNHIRAVAGMAIKIDGDANIVQQCCRLQKTPIVFAHLVQLHPTIEHSQGQLGDMARMVGIAFEQAQGVLAAALQNILGDNGHIIRFRIIIVKKALAQATAARDKLFGTCSLQQAANNAAACQNNITALRAKARNLFALL